MTHTKQAGQTVGRLFARYVSRNILGMLGISCYIIVDTFFISVASGADGITVLNLCLPIYNLIYGIGAMLGTGAAIRYAVGRSGGDRDADTYFFTGCFWAVLIGAAFTLCGALIPMPILRLMGADDAIAAMGVPYLRTFMLFTPFFMLNYIVSSFVRNDGAPSLAMLGTLAGSMFNLLFDYILMFPLGLGLFGAALATAFSPVASLLVCGIHFLRPGCSVGLVPGWPRLRRVLRCCRVGVAAFVGEFSSGVITTVFNFLLLALAGNVGVAAYGITANLALVATAIFNGVAQGSQPIISDCYGRGEKARVRTVLRLGLVTALAIAVVMDAAVFLGTGPIVAAFNSEGSAAMTAYATPGIRLYFLGFLFAGLNTVLAGYLSATDQAGPAMAVSLARGLVLIVGCALLLSRLWGVTGVWLAFPAAEALTLLLGVGLMLRRKTRHAKSASR